MKRIFIFSIIVFLIILLSATAVPAQAGVEPSPFKKKTILNRIRVARYQLEMVGATIDRFDLDANDRNIRGMYHSIYHLATKRGERSLSSLRSAEAIFEQRRDDDDSIQEYLDLLEEMRKYNEALRDELIEIEEDPNLPDILKEPLRNLGNILTDILLLLNEFLNTIHGIGNDNLNVV
jgi:hypothetical protein